MSTAVWFLCGVSLLVVLLIVVGIVKIKESASIGFIMVLLAALFLVIECLLFAHSGRKMTSVGYVTPYSIRV